MKFQRIIEQLNYQPWFISAQGYKSVSDVFNTYKKAFESNKTKSFLNLSDFVNPREDMMIDRDGIAHIHITGVLGQKMSKIEKSCGNTGYEQLADEIKKVSESNAIGVIFYLDSPGGSAVGAHSVAKMIQGLEIPTVGYCDSLACSACYYLAAGMDYVISTPDAIIGSIGTILPWVDKSVMWELKGLSFEPCLLYTSPSPRDLSTSRMPSSA